MLRTIYAVTWWTLALSTCGTHPWVTITVGMEKYNITAENLYNWDKKGFLISYASAIQRIISLEIFKSE